MADWQSGWDVLRGIRTLRAPLLWPTGPVGHPEPFLALLGRPGLKLRPGRLRVRHRAGAWVFSPFPEG